MKALCMIRVHPGQVDKVLGVLKRKRRVSKDVMVVSGRADICVILNTSITIIFGFSILILSNFIPTIYFGVFTGIAMLLAMISVLTLLPKLILTFKPFNNG